MSSMSSCNFECRQSPQTVNAVMLVGTRNCCLQRTDLLVPEFDPGSDENLFAACLFR
jgi:hypothetical protein